MLINRSDIQVKISITNSDKFLARATVILFGGWEEHGWRIMKSVKEHPIFSEQIWIQAPCFQTTDKTGKRIWKEIVYIEDKDTWELVQEAIYDAYHMARTKKAGLESVEEVEPEKPQVIQNQREEINQDDIPF